jgi:hypothetical protein
MTELAASLPTLDSLAAAAPSDPARASVWWAEALADLDDLAARALDLSARVRAALEPRDRDADPIAQQDGA